MTAYYNEIDPYAAQWLRNLIEAGHIAAGDVYQANLSRRWTCTVPAVGTPASIYHHLRRANPPTRVCNSLMWMMPTSSLGARSWRQPWRID